ncbi:pimeloyl-ACP methyl ester carboxylesterase [Tamilnaduibacter salinus]|uniref:Pimeloyl-ACP methyl ester carboxylesterase n=1 Tax=Tamilnaduibacter salinus TaxID=1484056 RepID=A0A2U1CWW6_9GAMM|nr:alpha/beta fold hydrolase [Tamilnaduibacter salinus]PVY76492.1 pimeloyl-ACP methyl ester carboxylesterase [Tamilnaduibacter salinus]
MKSLPLFALLATLVVLSGCSRHDLYESAIAMERSRADLEEKRVVVDGAEYAYLRSETVSDGIPLVMLHGFGANKDNWTRLANALPESTTLYALDLPGHGDSAQPRDRAYTHKAQVESLEAIFTELGLERFHLIGNSMGGAITALYTASHPNQVQSAILFAPGGITEFPSPLTEQVTDGRPNPLIVRKEGDLDKLIDFVMEQKPFIPWPVGSVMEEKAIARQDLNEQIFADIIDPDAGMDQSFTEQMRQIQAPVLIIWGQQDRALNVRNADIFERLIPNARVVKLDNVGHVPMMEVPERSAELVTGFLKDIQRQ